VAGQGGGPDAGAGRGGSTGVAGTGGTTGAAGTGGTTDAGPPDAGCASPCTLGGKRCSGNTVQTCVTINNCPAWDAGTACGARQTCSSNSCVCNPPPSGCGNAPGSFCSGGGATLETCLADANNCIYLGTPTTCPAGKTCGSAAGAAACMCANPASATDCPRTPTDYGNGKRCVGTTLVDCVTNADGCTTVTKTICPTSGACIHAYPTATCVSEQVIGYGTALGTTSPATPGYLVGIPITVTAPVTLKRLGAFAYSAGNGILALYSDVAGRPSARLAYSASTALVSGANEFAVASPPTPLTLAAGTYWIMASFQNPAMPTMATAVGASVNATQPVAFVTYTYGGPLPSPLPSPSTDVTNAYNMYIVALPQ
jgi:hypothetical protein